VLFPSSVRDPVVTVTVCVMRVSKIWDAIWDGADQSRCIVGESDLALSRLCPGQAHSHGFQRPFPATPATTPWFPRLTVKFQGSWHSPCGSDRSAHTRSDIRKTHRQTPGTHPPRPPDRHLVLRHTDTVRLYRRHVIDRRTVTHPLFHS
jgi:hypothetical protein